MKKFKRDLTIYHFLENDGAIIDDYDGMIYNFRWIIDFKDDDTLIAFTDLPDGGFNILHLETNYYLDNSNNVHVKRGGTLFEEDDEFIKLFVMEGAEHLYSSKSKTANSFIDKNERSIYYKDFFH